jgi:3-methyl-2-oxobutanoate hydroxymethyltransferase
MSSHPTTPRHHDDAITGQTGLGVPSDPGRLPMTLPLLAEKKRLSEPIVMVTAYDYPSARAAEAAGVDLVLVGDSAATTILGYNSTTPVDLDDMLVLARAVRRGLKTPLMIGDLPFGSYEISDEQAVSSAVRMVKEAGCDAVKLEGGGPSSASRARAIVLAGIPVMGHVGLTPQSSTALGGWKAQGRNAKAAARIASEALALQGSGCFAIVFEAIPSAVTKELMPHIEVPVIGIGAGPDTDGQVLVFHDLLGIYDGHAPRFAKRFGELKAQMVAGVAQYADEVRSGAFPAPEHTYSIDDDELAAFRSDLEATT